MTLKIVFLGQQADRADELSQMLSSIGHRLEKLGSIAEAEELLKSGGEHHYQLIVLLDQLGSGLSQVNPLLGLQSNLPVLALTKSALKASDFNLIEKGLHVESLDVNQADLKAKVLVLETKIKADELINNWLVSKKIIGPYVNYIELKFVLDSKITNTDPAIEYILSHLAHVNLSEEKIFHIKFGLTEVLTNAVVHGNLEMGSAEYKGKEQGFRLWNEDITKRAKMAKYSSRKISIELSGNPKSSIRLKVTDDGDGFDVEKTLLEVAKNTDPFASFGRGLMMVKGTAKNISFNDKGNEVTVDYDLTEED